MTIPRQLLLSPAAVRDLEDIAEWIAGDNPSRAASFVEELEARCAGIARRPHMYRLRDDLAPGVRSAVHGNYLVFFRELPCANAVRIERVVHGARDLTGLFGR